MKIFTKSLTLFFIGLLFSANAFAGEFVAKPYKLQAVKNTFQKPFNMPLSDLFAYPEEIAASADLGKIEDLSVVVTPLNPEIIALSKYEYYEYGKAQYLYFFQKPNIKGKTSIDITVTYKGKEVTNTLLFDIKDYIATDDAFDPPLTGTFTANILTNDQVSINSLKNSAVITIDEYPTLGTAVVKAGSPGVILYTPNAGLPNYSSDQLKYTVTLADGETSSAVARFSIHGNSYASKVIDFLPAPGQFTNEAIAKKNSAQDILGTQGGMISLGGFGGYVILGFDQPIVNRADNPYGVDFSIRGNSFVANLYGVWVEPAAVQVMKDTNGNGIPDDGEWYELAGSDYYLNTTRKNVEMTYYNPNYTVRYTVPWSTNHGDKGALLTNQFHQHPYYPDPFDFGCNKDSLTYSGNMILSSLDMSTKGYINFYRGPMFGYSDNRGNNVDLTKPNNPYFADAKGPARDGFDLNWAVDRNGNSVALDTVHFVKIYTAGNANAGWLGEWSSEVLGVGITTPDPDYVPQDYYINYLGINQLKVLKGEECQYEGILFKNGRPVKEGTQRWWTSDPSVGTVDNTGKFSALNTGQTKIYFTQKEDVPTDSIEVKVVQLESVVIEMEGNSAISSDETSLIAGETIFITAQCEDNVDGVLNGYSSNRYTYETFDWVTTNPEVGTINNGLFKGTKAGETMVYAISQSNPALKDSIKVIVKPAPVVEYKVENSTVTITDVTKASGSFKASDLFSTGTNSVVYLNSAVSLQGKVSVRIENNQLFYDFFGENSDNNHLRYNKLRNGSQIKDIVRLNITSYGVTQDVDIEFIYTDNTTSIENEKASSIYAYPNPFVDYIIVNSTSVEAVQVYDATGKCVVRYNLNIGENRIETSILPKGSYILKAGASTMKLIK